MKDSASHDPYGSFNTFTSRKAVLSIRKCYEGDLFHHLAVFRAMMDLSIRMIRKVHNPYGSHPQRTRGCESSQGGRAPGDIVLSGQFLNGCSRSGV